MNRLSAIAVYKYFFISILLARLCSVIFAYGYICPPLKLTSGQIRYRFRFRNVRFNCIRGYQLVGAKYANCMNGKWDAPTPICVKYGCRLPSTTHVNGQFIESYRGAVIKIICNPGYSLVGSPSVYCNGYRWNETFPLCNVTNLKPALSCNFDSNDLCGWSQDPMHDFNWKTMDIKSPPTKEIGAPAFDHTMQSNVSGVYMFMGSFDPRGENETARLFSPVYQPEVSYGSCFKFWYYMPEGNMDTLKVYVKPEGVELYDLIPSFWMSGDQGKDWVQGFFPIYPVETRFQIVIEGIKGANRTSSVAIDDVKITLGGECLIIENTTTSDYSTTVNQYGDQDDNYSALSCKNRCNQLSNLFSTVPNEVPAEQENREKCGCQEQCVQAKTCCSDFFDFCRFSGTTTTTETATEEVTQVMSSSQSTNSSNSSFTEPEIKALPNDGNKLSNEIDSKKPFTAIMKTYVPKKSQVDFESTTKTSTLSVTTSTRSKPEDIKDENKINTTFSPENNSSIWTEKVKKTNISKVVPPIKVTNVTQAAKLNGFKLKIPEKPKLVFQQPAAPVGPPTAKPRRFKIFLGKNVTADTPNQNPQENKTKNGKDFPIVTSSSTTVSPRRHFKIEKEKLPTNFTVQDVIKPTTFKSNDEQFQAKKVKDFSGKEPPQAIKIDANDDSRMEVVRQVLEIGGICSVLLVVTIALGIVFYRRSQNRNFERNSMVEDSDVRVLTSDEALDFTLARPADDDL